MESFKDNQLNEGKSKAHTAAVKWKKKLADLGKEAIAISHMAEEEGLDNLAWIMSRQNVFYRLNQIYGDILKNFTKDGLKSY